MPIATSLKAIKTRHGTKLVRFGAVSAFNVLFGQTILYAAQTALGWSAVASNILSVGIGAIPAYLLSRYWVWQKRGKNHFMTEVVPFWSPCLPGLCALDWRRVVRGGSLGSTSPVHQPHESRSLRRGVDQQVFHSRQGAVQAGIGDVRATNARSANCQRMLSRRRCSHAPNTVPPLASSNVVSAVLHTGHKGRGVS